MIRCVLAVALLAVGLTAAGAEEVSEDAAKVVAGTHLKKGLAREQSWYWYRKSARQGEPRAMFSLGYLCYIEGDYTEANTWFSRAVGLGHDRSLYWMAKLLWKGRGVVEDQKRARALIEQASKVNVPAPLTRTFRANHKGQER